VLSNFYRVILQVFLQVPIKNVPVQHILQKCALYPPDCLEIQSKPLPKEERTGYDSN